MVQGHQHSRLIKIKFHISLFAWSIYYINYTSNLQAIQNENNNRKTFKFYRLLPSIQYLEEKNIKQLKLSSLSNESLNEHILWFCEL